MDRADTVDLACGGCGYNLRGVPSDRCPECGRPFDPHHLIQDLIPWEQRHYIGRFRAFWQTAWMATFRPTQLAGKIHRPVDRTAGKIFQTWIVVIAGVTVVAAAWATREMGLWRFESTINNDDSPPEQLRALLLNPWTLGVTLIALLAWLAVAASIVGCWYHPKTLPVQLQNRALAISRYTCAPLAWSSLTILALCGLTVFGNWRRLGSDGQGELLKFLAVCLIVAQAVVWLWHRRRRDERARIHLGVALISAIVFVLGLSWTWLSDAHLPQTLIAVSYERLNQVLVTVAAAIGIWWWVTSVRMMKMTTRCGFVRTACMAAALPAMWLALLVALLPTAYAALFMFAMLLAW